MKRLALLIILFLMIGCGHDSIPDPKPLEVFEQGSIRVGSYDYDALAPVLEKSGDTLYIVNFWATWCAPCVAELPYFEKVTETKGDSKIRVLLISLDMKRDVKESLLPFIAKNELKSHVFHLHDPDADSWIPKVDSTWTGAIPATLMYRAGKRKFFERSFTQEELDKEIANF